MSSALGSMGSDAARTANQVKRACATRCASAEGEVETLRRQLASAEAAHRDELELLREQLGRMGLDEEEREKLEHARSCRAARGDAAAGGV